MHVEDGGSRDVRWHQVGGELNPSEFATEDPTERSDEKRFAQSGNRFDQHVTAREQRRQCAQDKLILADVKLRDFSLDLLKQIADRDKLRDQAEAVRPAVLSARRLHRLCLVKCTSGNTGGNDESLDESLTERLSDTGVRLEETQSNKSSWCVDVAVQFVFALVCLGPSEQQLT